MEQLPPVFMGVCLVTVLSPGPAVLMTLGNALTDRPSEVARGIAGVFFGSLVVATMVGCGMGALLREWPQAMTLLRWLSAAYLGWLGVRLWRASSRMWAVPTGVLRRHHFLDAMALQCLNPYTLAFFSSVLPRFVDPTQALAPQFAWLIGAYLTVSVAGHVTYAVLAHPARPWLASDAGGRALKRLSALLFWGLAGLMLGLSG